MCCSQTRIPDQACSNRAWKQRKPRKRKVAASHRKSTECANTSAGLRWVTVKRTMTFPEIYLWHKHGVRKQSKPRPPLQFLPGIPGEYRISQNLSGRNVYVLQPARHAQTRCHLGARSDPSQVPRFPGPSPGTCQRFPDSTLSIQHRSASDSASDWMNPCITHHWSWYLAMWLSSWSFHWVEETWWNWTRLKCCNPKKH